MATKNVGQNCRWPFMGWRKKKKMESLFVPHLQPMGLNVLGYQSHLLQRRHPACGHEGPSHLSLVFAYDFFVQCKFSILTTCQLMVEFYLLTFSRFPVRKKEHNFLFSQLTTSALLLGECSYLLDHSSDEGISSQPRRFRPPITPHVCI